MKTIKFATQTKDVAILNNASFTKLNGSKLSLITYKDGEGYTTCLYDEVTQTITLSRFNFYLDNATTVFTKTREQLNKIINQ